MTVDEDTIVHGWSLWQTVVFKKSKSLSTVCSNNRKNRPFLEGSSSGKSAFSVEVTFLNTQYQIETP